MLLFKTFNRFAPFNRCVLFKSSDFHRRLERLERFERLQPLQNSLVQKQKKENL